MLQYRHGTATSFMNKRHELTANYRYFRYGLLGYLFLNSVIIDLIKLPLMSNGSDLISDLTTIESPANSNFF